MKTNFNFQRPRLKKMRIIKDSPDLIIIKSGNAFGYIFGGLFVFLGVLILSNSLGISFINMSTDIPWWAAAFVIAIGLVTIFLPTVDLAVFDKNENKLERRRFSASRKCHLISIISSPFAYFLTKKPKFWILSFIRE